MVDSYPAHPELNLGDRFRVRSRRGSEYVVTFLQRGASDAGTYVRLDDRRIARLADDRVDWSTCALATNPGEPALVAGDELLVETPSGTVRGALDEQISSELVLRSSAGPALRIPRSTALHVWLLFPATELRAGDAFLVRSRTGNEYQGEVLAAHPDRLQVKLKGGREFTLRLERLDLDSLFVPIPLPLHAL